MFSVRIITADHYMCQPLHDLDVMYSDFRGSEVKQVPIIRIFGSTPTGEKVCLHVHGVFPYIYVPYDGLEQKEGEAYRLASSLDKAINVSLGKSNAVTQHVYKISLVSGRPFYGYHSKEHQFFKIFLYNPIMVKRAADLLQSGAVLSKMFQPHESHLTFILQFFIDFNLYGMNFINLSEVKFRRPLINRETATKSLENINEESIGMMNFGAVPEDLYLPESVSKMSICKIECDTLATAITNRSTVSEKMTVIPGLASIWEEEKERRRLHGNSSQLSIALSQTRKSSLFTKTELHYLEKMNDQFFVHKQADSSSVSGNDSVLDNSGYPSETPENVTLQSASLVEVQLPTPFKSTKKKTTEVSDVQTSPEEDHLFSTQHSVKFDSQDESLMNAWEGMLEEQDQDSILGSQMPFKVPSEVEKIHEDQPQEEVEDNLLLEMSQVFDWEERIQVKDHSDNITGSCADSEETADNKGESEEDRMLGCIEKKIKNGTVKEKELETEEVDEVCCVSELEDNFWNDEDEEDFDVSPIAQLDGADDFSSPKRKRNADVSVKRKTLGVRRQLPILLKKESPLQSKLLSSPSIGMNESNVAKSKDQPSSSAQKPTVSDSKPISGIERLNHQVVAKHKRIYELKRLNKPIISSSEKIKEDKKHYSPINVNLSLKRTTCTRSQLEEFENQSCSNVSVIEVIEKKIPDTKPCTVRLELIDEFHLKHLCDKHKLKISDSCLKLLRGVSLDEHFLYQGSHSENPEMNLSSKISYQQLDVDLGNFHESDMNVICQTPVGHKDTLSCARSNSFGNLSFSRYPNKKSKEREKPEHTKTMMRDNSFLELDSSIPEKALSPSRKMSKEKTDKKIRSPKNLNESKDKGSSDRNYYKPLDIVVQKSPTHLRNKKMDEKLSQQSPVQQHELQKSIDVSLVKEAENDHASNVNKIIDAGSCKLGKEDEIQNIERKVESPMSSESFHDSAEENQFEKDKSAVKRKLTFHDPLNDSQVSEKSGKRALSPLNDSICSWDEYDMENYSESSENDEEVGILSFCEEDVFNSTVLTPSFLVKSAKHSIIPTPSPLAVQKDEINQPTTKEGTFDSEMTDLNDMKSDSPNHSVLTLSSDRDSEEIQDTKDIFDLNFEAVDDNGIEYAPLLRAPSRKEVENYKYDQEPTGQLFCSDPDDIPSKTIEVGEVVLKLISNRPNCLPPFENCLGIVGLEGHRKRTLETLFGGVEELEIGNQWEKISKIALLPDAGSKDVIITPLQNPPKYEEVSKWMTDVGFHKEKKKIDDEVSVCSEPGKSRKFIVRGPMEGQSDDEDLEVISLSPCSTSSSQEITGKRSYMQSTPQSSVKQIQKHFQTPAHSDLEFSPIQAESDEDDIIMGTPPPAPEDESSFKKKGSKMKSSKLSWSRERLLRNTKSRKNIMRTIKEENSNSSSNNSMNDEFTSGESANTKKVKILEKHQSKLQNSFLIKQRHLVGLGGSGHSSCQIDGVSPNNTFGFQNSPSNLQNAKAVQKVEHVTVMTMEVHVRTRGDFRPDPEYDPIQAIFYCVMEDYLSESDKNKELGVILIDSSSEPVSQLMKKCGMTIKSVQTVSDEVSLFKNLADLMRKWDPDIVAGYEVEMLSWGYVLERGIHLGLDVKSLISRVPATTSVEANSKDKPNDPFHLDSKRIKDFEEYDPINLPGRIVLNVWRIMRSEVALTSYTFENVMYHLLHERVSLHSFKSLNNWWEHRTHLYRWITVEHWITRVEGVMRLLFQLDIIGRTSELARLFGIQFYEVFSRGSQFRVESIMLRFAKPLNYVCVSPNSKQRASMRAPEQLPLIMEPESRFFADPVIVLDFQSLYPSIIIAYNYCFSTCLGRVKHLGQMAPFEFGCTTLMVPPDTIAKLLRKQKKIFSEDDENSRSMISFSPCGIAFVGKGVREGILPRMLSQILETRLMVKKALKENKGNRVVERVLNNRQLGLKLIANVTYGYTSANFSGRMPCIEVGDSVVSKGRETLERAIDLVHKRWGSQGVRVVYGDTDSLFVLAKGFSRPEAFKLGAEIADLVTESNPSPVKLKLEKIFQPCLLQTKKRYVGYAYESPDQEKPVFDAKGIETVRRDGCPAVAKVLEKSLRLLFDTRDVSLVKLHVQRQLGKLLSGRLSLQELTFAREYRGAAGYRPGACVPALQLARRWVSIDRRAEPRSGERVPYVIISGPPGLPLFQLVRSPLELLMISKQDGPSGSSAQQPARVNAHYYVTKVLIPPLQRCFSLIGVDVESWYADMPRKFRSLIQPRGASSALDINLGKQVKGVESYTGTSTGNKKSTISAYFASSDCVACGSPLDPGNQAALCQLCQKNAHKTAFILASRCNSWERSAASLTKICQSCCKRMEPIECSSLDCPVLYRRDQAMLEFEQAAAVRKILSNLSW